MLKIYEELKASENYIIEIKPQTKTESGEWTKNKDYYNLKLTGADKRIITTQAGDKFTIYIHYFEIGDTKQKAFYEVPESNKTGKINYIVKQIMDLDLDAGHVINIIVDEKGFIKIEKVGGEKIKEVVEGKKEIENDGVDLKDIPF